MRGAELLHRLSSKATETEELNIPDTKKARFMHGCFSVKQNGNVSNVYVFGGESTSIKSITMKSTEVLNVNDLTWSDGPNLPIGMYENAGVESNDNQYLGFSVGGSTADGTQEEYQFKNIIYGLQKSGDNQKWVAFKSMNEPRKHASVVNVPSSLLTFC